MLNLSPVEIGCLVAVGTVVIFVLYHLHGVKAAAMSAEASIRAAVLDLKMQTVGALRRDAEVAVSGHAHPDDTQTLPTLPEHAVVAALMPGKAVATDQDAAFERAKVEAVAGVMKAQADEAIARATSQLVGAHSSIDAQAALDRARATQYAADAQAAALTAKANAEAARATAQARIEADLAAAKRAAGH